MKSTASTKETQTDLPRDGLVKSRKQLLGSGRRHSASSITTVPASLLSFTDSDSKDSSGSKGIHNVRNGGQRRRSSWAALSSPVSQEPKRRNSNVIQPTSNHSSLDGFTMNQLRFSSLGLYGREEELSRLQSAFRQIQKKASDENEPNEKGLALVYGYSGAGKSALVAKIEAPVRKAGGFYAMGKFDQQRRVEPYTAFVAAFTRLCDDILELPSQDMRDLKNAIREAVGSEGAVLTDIIPKLQEIIGTDTDTPTDIKLQAAQNRFNYLVRQFCRVVASKRPLVLIMDDLQWADAASLEMMEVLVMDKQISGMLFVGCYRDNEVDQQTHPLAARLRRIEQDKDSALAITKVHVGNLSVATVNELISDVLSCPKEKTKTLADLVHKRTLGNVFFVISFMNSLRDQGMLSYNLGILKWSWNEDEIKTRTSITDNVVDLMQTKIRSKLSTETQHVLQIAACLGASFEAPMLERVSKVVSDKGIFERILVSEESQEQASDRVPADDKRIIQQLDACVEEGLIELVAAPRYRFLHDSIQSAAFRLVPEDLRGELQYQIGLAIVDSSIPTELDDVLFVAVNLLNQKGDQSEPQDKIQLANFNLRAGKKAMESAAFVPASTYLRTGIGLLGPNHWKDQVGLTLDLYSSLAEAEYCNGNFDEMRRHIDAVLEQNHLSVQDKFRAYSTLIYSLDVQDRMHEAIDTSLSVLGHFGVRFPKRARKLAAPQSLVKTKLLLRGRSIESLSDLPPMQDENRLMAMELFADMLPSCYRVAPDLVPLVAFKMVRWSTRYGFCKHSPVAFGFFGVILCGGMGDLRGGNEMGDVALSLSSRHDARATEANTSIIVNLLVKPWNSPVQLSLKPFLRCYQLGLETGDIQYAMLNILLYCFVSLLTGRPLASIENDMRTYGQQMKEYNQSISYIRLLPCWQFVLNLIGRSDSPNVLEGEATRLRTACPEIEMSDNEKDCYRVSQIWLACIYGDYELAEKSYTEADFDATLFSTIENWRSVCFGCLASFVMARETKSRSSKRRALKLMKRVKVWVEKGHVNCVHMLHLLSAELAALEGKVPKAEEEYSQAVTTAGRHGFLCDRALANERAGKFFVERGDNDWAAHYFRNSHQAYIDWGAHTKADHLREKYASFLGDCATATASSTQASATRRSTIH